jgi:hypothetical protein
MTCRITILTGASPGVLLAILAFDRYPSAPEAIVS